jgi:hypothetical protein
MIKMRHVFSLACVAVLGGAVGCNQPVKLAFSSPPPERVTERGPLTLPPVQAFNRDGEVIAGAKVTVEALPAGIVVDRPEGLSVINRGNATLTYTAGKATMTHALKVRLPTRVELRCMPSCFGSVGSETKLDTTVYSEEETLGDLQAPCSTDRPSVAKVDGATLRFLDTGKTVLTCKLGEAEVTRDIEVVPPAPPPPVDALPADSPPVVDAPAGE